MGGRGVPLKDCVQNNSDERIMLIGFIFLSNKLSEDGMQKKMSSLCLELMKLRNQRDAKEKVWPFVLHRIVILSCSGRVNEGLGTELQIMCCFCPQPGVVSVK